MYGSVSVDFLRPNYDVVIILMNIYTNETKKLWDFNIAADLQELSKIKIYVDTYVIEHIFKTSTQNGNEVVTHITHMMYGRKEGVILSLTNLVGLFIAGISPCKAWEHGQSCQITGEGLRSDIQ